MMHGRRIACLFDRLVGLFVGNDRSKKRRISKSNSVMSSRMNLMLSELRRRNWNCFSCSYRRSIAVSWRRVRMQTLTEPAQKQFAHWHSTHNRQFIPEHHLKNIEARANWNEELGEWSVCVRPHCMFICICLSLITHVRLRIWNNMPGIVKYSVKGHAKTRPLHVHLCANTCQVIRLSRSDLCIHVVG